MRGRTSGGRGLLRPLPARKRNTAWYLSGTRCVPFRVPPYCAVLAPCACCEIATLTQRPMDNKQFLSGDVAEWLKAAVC